MIYKKQRVAVVGDVKPDKIRVITLELRESHIQDLSEIAILSTHKKAGVYVKAWQSFMKEVDKKGKK